MNIYVTVWIFNSVIQLVIWLNSSQKKDVYPSMEYLIWVWVKKCFSLLSLQVQVSNITLLLNIRMYSTFSMRYLLFLSPFVLKCLVFIIHYLNCRKTPHLHLCLIRLSCCRGQSSSYLVYRDYTHFIPKYSIIYSIFDQIDIFSQLHSIYLLGSKYLMIISYFINCFRYSPYLFLSTLEY